MPSILPDPTLVQVDDALFPGYEPLPVREPGPKVSADRRRTMRQAGAIASGTHPLTRAPIHELASRHRDSTSPKNDPFTCGSCFFRLVVKYHNKSYAKCIFDPRADGADSLDEYARVSHSASSDVRAWWPACRDYSPGDRISSDAARYVPEASA